MKEIVLRDQQFVLHPSGAVFWHETSTWLLADVHLGKVAHFRKHGIAVPRKAEGEFYQKIKELSACYPPKRILFLGDLFHSSQNNEWLLFVAWAKKQSAKLVLIKGNHDLIPDSNFKSIGVQVYESLHEGHFCFSHYPQENTKLFVFCGHLHPGIKLHGRGKQQLKLPCFFHAPNQLILPAFGAFTGLHLVKPTPNDRIYVTTGKGIHEIKGKMI